MCFAISLEFLPQHPSKLNATKSFPAERPLAIGAPPSPPMDRDLWLAAARHEK